MRELVVASFRAASGPDDRFAARAEALIGRLSQLGAAHVGFDPLRLTFSIDPLRLAPLLEGVAAMVAEAKGDAAWAVGIAQGPIEALRGAGSSLLATGLLAWGPAAALAAALAGRARAGEILCDESVTALGEGALLETGSRRVMIGGRRVRVARIDQREPTKRARLEESRPWERALVRSTGEPIALEAGAVLFVRADPGAGGSRLLAALAARGARSLVVSPVGSGCEPLGALRRALMRSLAGEPNPLLLDLAGPLEELLSGRGVTLEDAAQLVVAALWTESPGARCVALDDAAEIDPATLEACARAVRSSAGVAMVARLDAASPAPRSLEGLPKAADQVTVPLSPGDASAAARSEEPERARPSAIRERLERESAAARLLLSLCAVLGGEARATTVAGAVEALRVPLDVAGVLSTLRRSGWLVEREEGWIALPSRTHRRVLVEALDDAARKRLSGAIALALEGEEGVLSRVEPALHAARAGQGPRAASALLDAAGRAATLRLDDSAIQLVRLARRADPRCEPVPFGSPIAMRLGELSREALRAADGEALERWVDGLRAAGGGPALTERMRAMTRLGRGEVGDALRVLRHTRAELDPSDHRKRCQTSLALGVALSVAGRPDEALVEAMDALARAREHGDRRAVDACLAFLTKLYAAASRDADAARLRALARS